MDLAVKPMFVAAWLAAWFIVAQDLPAAQIYWSDLNGMHRAALDGTQSETLDGEEYARSLHLDLDAGYTYWSSARKDVIVRARLDGTDSQLIAATASGPEGLAIDSEANLIYWTEPEGASLIRSTLAGGSPTTLVSHHPLEGLIVGVAVDAGQSALYWSEAGQIWKGDLNAKNAVAIFSATVGPPAALALDPVGGWLYWASQTDDVGRGANIQRARLDGSQLETLVEFEQGSGVMALDLKLDPIDGMLYWTQIQGNVSGSIWRSNSDGSQAGKLFDAGIAPAGLAIDHTIPGDANGDRVVNLEDFGLLKANFGAGSRRSQGDLNADHQIDLSDFGILKANFGGSAAAVPEPATWLLLAVGGLALVGCKGLWRRAPL